MNQGVVAAAFANAGRPHDAVPHLFPDGAAPVSAPRPPSAGAPRGAADPGGSILLLYMPTAEQKVLPAPPLGLAVLQGYLQRKGFKAAAEDLEMADWETDITALPLLKPLARRLPLRLNNPKRIFQRAEVIHAHLSGARRSSAVSKALHRWAAQLDHSPADFAFVGFSVMSAHQLVTSLCFADYLRRHHSARILLGGSFITHRTRPLLRRYPFLDHLVLGPGERPLAALLAGRAPGTIPGLISQHHPALPARPAAPPPMDEIEPRFDGLPLPRLPRPPCAPPGAGPRPGGVPGRPTTCSAAGIGGRRR